jgi:hypothetical protein
MAFSARSGLRDSPVWRPEEISMDFGVIEGSPPGAYICGT